MLFYLPNAIENPSSPTQHYSFDCTQTTVQIRIISTAIPCYLTLKCYTTLVLLNSCKLLHTFSEQLQLLNSPSEWVHNFLEVVIRFKNRGRKLAPFCLLCLVCEDGNSTGLARWNLLSIQFSHQNDSSLKMCCKHQLLRAIPMQSGCRTSAAKFERLLLDSTNQTHKKRLSCLVCLLSKNGKLHWNWGNDFLESLTPWWRFPVGFKQQLLLPAATFPLAWAAPYPNTWM